MVNGLVTEARPIPLERLSESEKEHIRQANVWINAVLKDGAKEKPGAANIDEGRSGRVLFIDGVRGAGKTSLLLTILKLWRSGQTTEVFTNAPNTERLHVFLPVLDFDPLPAGLPVHGWLLEPWRAVALKQDKEPRPGVSDGDLSEKFAELFERVLSGWTQAEAQGKGVVEKAIAYQEQASGWLETSAKWNDFVNTMLCRMDRCPEQPCKGKHSYVFVIAVDDVDLQVEQLPKLLHATRLLSHPNVAYLFTGDYKHLRFATKLDYLGRHNRLLVSTSGEVRKDAEKHSSRLADALLQKALPEHAVLKLDYLSFRDVLRFAAHARLGANVEDVVVEDVLHADTWTPLPKRARALAIATARTAQHAVDKLPPGASKLQKLSALNTLEFIADFCGSRNDESRGSKTDSDEKEDSKTDSDEKADSAKSMELTLRGELTTELGQRLKVWHGDNLRVVLTDEPLFHFYAFDGPELDGPEAQVQAHQVLLVQLLLEATSLPPNSTEGKAIANAEVPPESASTPRNAADQVRPLHAHALDWMPDAGVAATFVSWGKYSEGKTAVFHWPWLVRPTAQQALSLGDVARQMKTEAPGPSDITEAMVAVWLLENVQWRRDTPGRGGRKTKSDNEDSKDQIFSEFVKRLKNLHTSNSDAEFGMEIERWVRELLVMTSPYFGLPSEVASSLRKRLEEAFAEACNREAVKNEELRMIGNAITAKVGDNRRSRLQGSTGYLSEDRLDKEVQAFRKERKGRAHADPWWKWIGDEGST